LTQNPDNPVLDLEPPDVQRFRGGLVLKTHSLCASLNSRLECNKEEEEEEEEEEPPNHQPKTTTTRRSIKAAIQGYLTYKKTHP